MSNSKRKLPSDPHDFTPDDWMHLFEDRGLFHAMVITQEQSPTTVFSIRQGLKLASDLVLPDAGKGTPTFTWLIPNITAELHTVETFFQTVHTYHSQGYDVEKAKIGVPGIFSVDFERAHQYTNDQSFSETDYYVTSMYRVPKLEIGFAEGAMTLTDDFIAALTQAVEPGVNDPRSYENVTNVLNDWGHYFVKQLDLGGLLYGTDTKKITSMSEGHSFSDSVSAGFEADLTLEDVPISGGGSGGTGHGGSDQSGSTNTDHDVTISVIGGDGSLMSKYPAWAASLNGNYVSWHIINTIALEPVINLIPDKKLRYKVANVISAAYGVTPYIQAICDEEHKELGD
ncbi:MAC/perforin domain-containing protein [Sorangium sp. So ce269]